MHKINKEDLNDHIFNGDKIIDISKGVKPVEYYKKILLNL